MWKSSRHSHITVKAFSTPSTSLWRPPQYLPHHHKDHSICFHITVKAFSILSTSLQMPFNTLHITAKTFQYPYFTHHHESRFNFYHTAVKVVLIPSYITVMVLQTFFRSLSEWSRHTPCHCECDPVMASHLWPSRYTGGHCAPDVYHRPMKAGLHGGALLTAPELTKG